MNNRGASPRAQEWGPCTNPDRPNDHFPPWFFFWPKYDRLEEAASHHSHSELLRRRSIGDYVDPSPEAFAPICRPAVSTQQVGNCRLLGPKRGTTAVFLPDFTAAWQGAFSGPRALPISRRSQSRARIPRKELPTRGRGFFWASRGPKGPPPMACLATTVIVFKRPIARQFSNGRPSTHLCWVPTPQNALCPIKLNTFTAAATKPRQQATRKLKFLGANYRTALQGGIAGCRTLNARVVPLRATAPFAPDIRAPQNRVFVNCSTGCLAPIAMPNKKQKC